jgi:hypothetical protein
MPPSYFEKVEQSNNSLAFLVNCSALSVLFSCLSFLAAFHQSLVCIWGLCAGRRLKHILFEVNPKLTYLAIQRVEIYLVLGLVAIGVSWFFYRASFPLVQQYGNMIRSAFDLFRFDLLRQLKQELPEDSEEEYDLWRKISEFIAVGERFGSLPLEYKYQTAADSTGKGESSG